MAEDQTWLPMLQKLVGHPELAPPVAKLIGFEPVEISAGSATFTLTGDPAKHANPMGTMHGGILVDLGDAAMGMAMASTLAVGETFTTIEMKANYFKPVFSQKLRATAKMIRRSRKLGYLECEITDDKGALVCKLASTCMVLSGDDAKGR
jgi:uncharacterized protein (TIGR00369 family)